MKSFLLAGFLIASVSGYGQSFIRSKDKDAILIDTTVKPAPFETTFINDSSYEDPLLTSYKYRTLQLGKIKLESGRLIACDAIDLHKNIAFVQDFPKGEFPVQISIGWDDSDSEFPIYLRIKFSNEPVTRWAYALKPGMKDFPLADTGILHCFYSKYSGTSVLIDQTANLDLNKKSHREWTKMLIKDGDEIEYPGTARLIKFGKHSLAMFQGEDSNYCYQYYIGYDKEGRICRFLKDLGTL
jgi:hypothetical protein